MALGLLLQPGSHQTVGRLTASDLVDGIDDQIRRGDRMEVPLIGMVGGVGVQLGNNLVERAVHNRRQDFRGNQLHHR